LKKVGVAIVGPGNIGTDLLFKIRRSNFLDLKWVIGIKESEGIQIAKSFGIKTDITGLEPMLKDSEVKIVFDATSAAPHIANAPLYKDAGKIAIDLTPAAVGPYVVPAVNIDKLTARDNMLKGPKCMPAMLVKATAKVTTRAKERSKPSSLLWDSCRKAHPA